MEKALHRSSWFFVVILFLTVSCQSTVVVKGNSQKVPPGQMKKATGSQSAKEYAPGQQKKK